VFNTGTPFGIDVKYYIAFGGGAGDSLSFTSLLFGEEFRLSRVEEGITKYSKDVQRDEDYSQSYRPCQSDVDQFITLQIMRLQPACEVI
jgi:hypothetical protein